MKTKIISALLCIATILSMVGIFGTSAFAYDYYESENNDTIVKANTIEVNSYVYGSLGGNSDDTCDYYKFNIRSSGYIQITLSDDYETQLIHAYLQTYDGTSINSLEKLLLENKMERKSTAKIGLKPGTYYIQITSSSTSKIRDYNFIVNYVASNDWESEPNNSIPKANTINANKTYYGSTHGYEYFTADEDYFKFTLNINGNATVYFNHGDTQKTHFITLFSYDGTSKEVFLNFTINNQSEHVTSNSIYLTAGTYYLFINDSAGSNYCDYNLKINFTTGSAEKPTVKATKPQANTTRPTASTTRPTAAQPSYSNEPDATLPDYHDYDMVTGSSLNNNTYEENNYTPNGDNTYNEIFDDIDFDVKDMMNNGNFEYYIENGYITIHLYLGGDSEVVIPEYLNGYEVKGLASNLFADTDVKKVEVPSCVNEFGENAFGQNSGKDIEIVCEKNSPVEVYAEDNGIRYVYKPYSTDADTAKTNSTRNIIIIIAGVAAAALVITATVLYFVKKKSTIRG